MRERHLNHLLELTKRCREYYPPLSIEFSSCPPTERRRLLCYESGRELDWLRDYVQWMRTGTISEESYWRPIPQFGWAEWPVQPYMDIPTDERAQHITRLSPRQDDWIKALPLL